MIGLMSPREPDWGFWLIIFVGILTLVIMEVGK